MTGWGPLDILFFVILALVLPLPILGWEPAKLPRLLIALIVTAIFQFAVLFVAFGFGWGWGDPSPGALLVGRMSIGASMGIAASLFSWVLTRRFRAKIASGTILLDIAILVPDTNWFSEVQWPLSILIVYSGVCLWFREEHHKCRGDIHDR